MNFERMKVDVSYWNKMAPEGATCLIDKSFFVKWGTVVSGTTTCWTPTLAKVGFQKKTTDHLAITKMKIYGMSQKSPLVHGMAKATRQQVKIVSGD